MYMTIGYSVVQGTASAHTGISRHKSRYKPPNMTTAGISIYNHTVQSITLLQARRCCLALFLSLIQNSLLGVIIAAAPYVKAWKHSNRVASSTQLACFLTSARPP
ncbi:hypothetical protein D3C78_1064890 [compost metagenome]